MFLLNIAPSQLSDGAGRSASNSGVGGQGVQALDSALVGSNLAVNKLLDIEQKIKVYEQALNIWQSQGENPQSQREVDIARSQEVTLKQQRDFWQQILSSRE